MSVTTVPTEASPDLQKVIDLTDECVGHIENWNTEDPVGVITPAVLNALPAGSKFKNAPMAVGAIVTVRLRRRNRPAFALVPNVDVDAKVTPCRGMSTARGTTRAHRAPARRQRRTANKSPGDDDPAPPCGRLRQHDLAPRGAA